MEDEQKVAGKIDQKLDSIRKETMTNADKKPPVITGAMIESVKGIGPWTRFLSVMGFISVGLMIIAAAGMLGISLFAGGLGGNTPAGMIIAISALYVIIAILYIFPSLYLWNTAGAVVRMKKGDIVGGMETALAKQKSFWKFIGIMMIVLLVMYPVFIIVIVALGAMNGLH
ncbi:MAG: hypothetical protein GXO70_10435 [Acidobacteria bacterium]|nr:hypothetical protein [Acidobacteriota bacterium]